ncbi:4Fe-4S cluster-binding domain-containing protein [candidate division KSB1 bacterium]|nr:4Fe-4S cluster-binding domain-containing protein [candidate division KSB1 bacterium]
MANIAITSLCSLNCPYCFTQNIYDKKSNTLGHLTMTVLKQALDFVGRSEVREIRILGGEPTLHPEF